MDLNQLQHRMDEISDRVGAIDSKVSYLVGKLDATLPHLATTDELELAIQKHRAGFHPKKTGPTKKFWGALTGLLAAIGAAIVTLVEVFKK